MSTVVTAAGVSLFSGLTAIAVIGVVFFSPFLVSGFVALFMLSAGLAIMILTCNYSTTSGDSRTKRVEKMRKAITIRNKRDQWKLAANTDARKYMSQKDLEELEERVKDIRLRRLREIDRNIDSHLNAAAIALQESKMERQLQRTRDFPLVDTSDIDGDHVLAKELSKSLSVPVETKPKQVQEQAPEHENKQGAVSECECESMQLSEDNVPSLSSRPGSGSI